VAFIAGLLLAVIRRPDGCDVPVSDLSFRAGIDSTRRDGGAAHHMGPCQSAHYSCIFDLSGWRLTASSTGARVLARKAARHLVIGAVSRWAAAGTRGTQFSSDAERWRGARVQGWGMAYVKLPHSLGEFSDAQVVLLVGVGDELQVGILPAMRMVAGAGAAPFTRAGRTALRNMVSRGNREATPVRRPLTLSDERLKRVRSRRHELKSAFTPEILAAAAGYSAARSGIQDAIVRGPVPRPGTSSCMSPRRNYLHGLLG